MTTRNFWFLVDCVKKYQSESATVNIHPKKGPIAHRPIGSEWAPEKSLFPFATFLVLTLLFFVLLALTL